MAVIWNGTSFTSLGDFAGGAVHATAFDISADGSFVVGYGTTAAGQRGLVWSQALGLMDVATFLATQWNLGIEFAGWTITSVSGVSANHLWMTGSGINPLGQTQSWSATLTAVPEPSSYLMLGIGLLMSAIGLKMSRKKKNKVTLMDKMFFLSGERSTVYPAYRS